MLSISTSWMDSETDIKSWLPQVKELGFDAIELSYKVTEDQLKEAESLLGKLGLKVSSIHNFCPTPNDGTSTRHISNYYRLSSVDEEERKSAVKWTKIAVDTALRVGAGVVVIHAGTLDFEDERSPHLFELYVNGQADSGEFLKERRRILNLREEKKGPFIKALTTSLVEVMTYSQQKNVLIGLETRYYPIEIPNFDEIAYFLDLFGRQGMRYWHDVGHAEINDRLGITLHKDFLETYKDQLIGVHLHGVLGRRDHLAPFEGDMDLAKIMPFLKKNVSRVIEARYATVEQMRNAIAKL